MQQGGNTHRICIGDEVPTDPKPHSSMVSLASFVLVLQQVDVILKDLIRYTLKCC